MKNTHQPSVDSASTFSKKVLSIRRVSKTVKGGKILRLSTLVVVGDGKGRIGQGLAKANESVDAFKKATEKATHSMVKVPLKRGETFHHDSVADYNATCVILRTAKKGTGIIAGGAARSVLEALGVKDAVCKIIGSSNPHNVVRALFKCFAAMKSPRMVAQQRYKKLSEFSNKSVVEA